MGFRGIKEDKYSMKSVCTYHNPVLIDISIPFNHTKSIDIPLIPPNPSILPFKCCRSFGSVGLLGVGPLGVGLLGVDFLG